MSTTTIALWAVAAGVVLTFAGRYGVGWRLVLPALRRDWVVCRSVLDAATIRRRWPRLAVNLGLTLADRTVGPPGSPADVRLRSYITARRAGLLVRGRVPKAGVVHRAPKIRVRADRYGVLVELVTLPGVGLVEVQKHERHLADAWGACRVAIAQERPGRVRVRAIRRDPLEEVTTYAPVVDELVDPVDVRVVPLGVDEYGDAVELRLAQVPGVVLAGLPGFGKTTLLTGLVAKLAPSPVVQFVLIDGKAVDPREDGDYTDLVPRFTRVVGDDMDAAHKLLVELVELRRARQRSIRVLLGVNDMWAVGPSVDWPLVVIVIDESHTFFRMPKVATTDKAGQARNVLASQNVIMVEELIKLGRNVGFVTIVATQKQTGDAVPTQIRDVCPVSLAFACRTTEAAVAGLGDDVRQHPETSPVRLQDPKYVGVLAMRSPRREGFVWVRVPGIAPSTAAAVATATQALVLRRGELPAPRPAAMIAGNEDE